MRWLRLFSLPLLLASLALCARAQSPAVFPNPGSLANELHRLEMSLSEGHSQEVLASLPASWAVVASGKRYSVSTTPLRRLIASPEQAQRWLLQVARQLESYSAAPGTPSSHSAAHAQLNRILARREFAAVEPPTLWERILRRIFDWIAGIVSSLIGYAKQHPTSGMILFGLAAALAICSLGFWLLRRWGGKRRLPLSQPEPPAPNWTWQQWVVLAREARDRKDMRASIHCAYWAAVVRLQDLQRLPRDLTRTPREYLGLLPDYEVSHAPLAALTASLERFWYAARPASPADLRESLDHMEALGCRLD
jgi:hypothetical protein